MRRRTYILAIIILCVIAEIVLIQLVPFLESHNYPLLSSLTCIETEDSNDLYWNINQIEIAGSSMREDHSLTITLKNNIPGFDSYLFRMDTSELWEKPAHNEFTVQITKDEHFLEVKAVTTMGNILPPETYSIVLANDALSVVPDARTIVRGKYDFRFENTQSPKVQWLQQYTVPVIAGSPGQWDMFLRLRKWVREQIPFTSPTMKSHWDAQRILQAVWKNTAVGFQCGAYAATYVSACISAGLNARMIHLESGDGRGHNATEVWSDDYSKWVFMDPLFDWCFTMDGVPLSTLELHNLWKAGEWNSVDERDGHNNRSDNNDIPDEKYFSLFHDIQLVNSNDFLSNPFTSVIDLLTLKIRYLRWIDASNPRYNKASLAMRLLVFYYFPKISKVFIVPAFIPCVILVMCIVLIRETYRSS
jgi:hypothetical protein